MPPMGTIGERREMDRARHLGRALALLDELATAVEGPGAFLRPLSAMARDARALIRDEREAADAAWSDMAARTAELCLEQES